jgi:ParB-like chromosome segregation protein Spo0J
MSADVRTVFERKIISVPTDRLLPTRDLKAADSRFGKYKAILASIPAMGLIEPIAVHPCRGKPGYYIVLDGHARLKALIELKHADAPCLVATEDDPFTYNDKISRLSCIQEHRMIMRAVASGVSPEQIANALAVNLDRIRESMNVLNGVHPEAAEKLKDKAITPAALRLFRKVKPMRQLEFADLMVSMNDFSVAYTKALLLATTPSMLEAPEQPKLQQLKPEEIAQMEREMENLERDFKVYQDSYGENALSLNVVQRYVQRLLANPEIKKFLARRFPEILDELTAVASMESL